MAAPAGARPRRLGALLVFSAVFVAYVASPKLTPYDSRWAIPSAVSFVEDGDFVLDEYRELLARNTDGSVRLVDGHFRARHPIGAVLIAVPAVWVAQPAFRLVVRSFPELGEYIRRQAPYPVESVDLVAIYPFVELAVASLVMALASTVLYSIAARRLGERDALLVAFVFAFCTSAWSTASRGLWQHGPSMLMLAIALKLLLASERRPALLLWLGITLGFSYVVRPTNSIAIVWTALFVLARQRTEAWRFVAGGLLIGVPFVAWNLNVYGALLPPYYVPSRLTGHAWSEGLLGNLLSPGRGLFVFSPVLLFSILGFHWKRRVAPEASDLLLAAIVISHWAVISSNHNWWAGHCFGPRLFADMIPYLVYFQIFAIERLRASTGWSKTLLATVFGAALVVSFAIHLRGASSRAVYLWNSTPSDINRAPERAWDWRDPQFLRGLDGESERVAGWWR